MWRGVFSCPGFVEHEQCGAVRATPHAFSRFTYEASHGRLMVVDIQGVDDLFTDPQIHSFGAAGEGGEYGDGDLGVGGMALFFSTSAYCMHVALQPSRKAAVCSRLLHATQMPQAG